MPFTRQTLPRTPALVNERFRVTVFCLDRASAPQKGSCSGSSCMDLAAQRHPASRRFWKLISRFQGRRNVERSDFRMLALRTYGQPLGPRPRQEAVCPGGQCWSAERKVQPVAFCASNEFDVSNQCIGSIPRLLRASPANSLQRKRFPAAVSQSQCGLRRCET